MSINDEIAKRLIEPTDKAVTELTNMNRATAREVAKAANAMAVDLGRAKGSLSNACELLCKANATVPRGTALAIDIQNFLLTMPKDIWDGGVLPDSE